MSKDNSITIIGNLTRDPELRFTTGGDPVCNFSVAQSERKPKEGGGWEDGPVSFFNCSVWRDLAEHVAESLGKGMRIIVTGRMQQRDWEDDDGNKRTSWELQVDEVGPSLRWGTVTYHKAERENTGRSGGGSRQPDPIYGDEEPF